jgi:hypothetical protein
MDGLAAEIERLGRAIDALARPDGAAGPEIGGGHGPAPMGGEAEDQAAGGPGRRE